MSIYHSVCDATPDDPRCVGAIRPKQVVMLIVRDPAGRYLVDTREPALVFPAAPLEVDGVVLDEGKRLLARFALDIRVSKRDVFTTPAGTRLHLHHATVSGAAPLPVGFAWWPREQMAASAKGAWMPLLVAQECA